MLMITATIATAWYCWMNIPPGDNLARHGGEETGHFEVDTDIGIVDIDNVAATQVGKVGILTISKCRRHRCEKGNRRSSRRDKVTTIALLGIQL